MVEAEITKLGSIKYPKTITSLRRTQTFRAQVDTGQTITLSIGTLVAAIVCKVSDGTTITHTEALGVITITEAALTNVDVVGFAVGSAS